MITQHSVITVVCRTGDQKYIGVFGIAHIDNAEPFYIIEGGKGSKYLYIAAVTATTIEVQ